MATFNLTVRLIGGNVASNAGRVEILLTGFWGTVCDLSWWDLREANVVCRELGYEKASIAPTGAAFGQGIGIVWTTSLQCLGNEKTLTQCKNSGWNLTSCRHDRDVSVICTPRGIPSKFNGSVLELRPRKLRGTLRQIIHMPCALATSRLRLSDTS